MASNTVFYAEMSCGGCSGAITRLIKKMEGVTNVDCDVDKNTVVVTSTKKYDVNDYLKKIEMWAKSAGKKTSAGPL